MSRGTAVLILFGMLAVAALRWGVSVVATTALIFTLTAAALTAAGWYLISDHGQPATLMLAGAPFELGPIPPAEGVYLLGADTDDDGQLDRFKIGFGSSMADRVASFQTGSPVDLHDVGFWRTADYKTLETRLHDHYADQRLELRGSKREWIEASPDLLAELTAMGARLDV